jgi:hypothetical protein
MSSAAPTFSRQKRSGGGGGDEDDDEEKRAVAALIERYASFIETESLHPYRKMNKNVPGSARRFFDSIVGEAEQ